MDDASIAICHAQPRPVYALAPLLNAYCIELSYISSQNRAIWIGPSKCSLAVYWTPYQASSLDRTPQHRGHTLLDLYGILTAHI